MSFWQKIIRSGKSLKSDRKATDQGRDSRSSESVDTATIEAQPVAAATKDSNIDTATIDFAPDPQDEAPPMPPARFELIEGSLFAGINLHEVNLGNSQFSCWSYLSDGLSKYGQKEMSFLVKIAAGKEDDEYPLAPLGFLYTVKDYASKGQFVDDWDITEFGNTGFIAPQFRALAYLPPESISAFENTNQLITGVPITDEELNIVKTYGMTRLIGLLGQAFSHYPCPPWVDLERKSVVTAATLQAMQQSIVAKLPHLRVPGVTVSLTENDIVLRVQPRARGFLEQQLKQIPDSFPIVLRADLDRHANGLLVWQSANDQQAPSAITPPGSDGSRISGAFIIFIPEQDETEGQVLEDGFVLRVKNDVWQILRKHLFNGTNVRIMADTAGMNLVLEWVGKESDNTQTVEPQSQQVGDVQATGAQVKQLVLLTSETECANSISPQLLANFASLIETTVVQFFARSPRPCPGVTELVVLCKILPQKKSEWTINAMPAEEASPEKLTELQAQLDSLSVPSLTGEPISFKVIFSLQ